MTMSVLLEFERLLPAPTDWILLGLLVLLLAAIGLLTSVVHAGNDAPAERLCEVIRAWRGLPARPKTDALLPKRRSINRAGHRSKEARR